MKNDFFVNPNHIKFSVFGGEYFSLHNLNMMLSCIQYGKDGCPICMLYPYRHDMDHKRQRDWFSDYPIDSFTTEFIDGWKKQDRIFARIVVGFCADIFDDFSSSVCNTDRNWFEEFHENYMNSNPLEKNRVCKETLWYLINKDYDFKYSLKQHFTNLKKDFDTRRFRQGLYEMMALAFSLVSDYYSPYQFMKIMFLSGKGSYAIKKMLGDKRKHGLFTMQEWEHTKQIIRTAWNYFSVLHNAIYI